MDLINTPISKVSFLNEENPENQADQFWTSLPKIITISTQNPNLLHKTINTIFKKWDAENAGCFSAQEFEQFYENIGSSQIPCNTDEIFSFIDSNGDGCGTSFKEMIKAVKKIAKNCDFDFQG